MGSLSSYTPVATSLSAMSITFPALSKMAVSAAEFAQEERMSEVQLSPDQIVEALPKYLIPEKAGSTKATIVFELSGADAGKWWVKIHDGTAESGKGEPPETPNLTLQADAGDWVKIMTGAMDGTSAFMQGKLKIKGDMGLAIKMQTLFKRP
jgi:putative sterol carrier protein